LATLRLAFPNPYQFFLSPTLAKCFLAWDDGSRRHNFFTLLSSAWSWWVTWLVVIGSGLAVLLWFAGDFSPYQIVTLWMWDEAV
jgi:hypothetical protein